MDPSARHLHLGRGILCLRSSIFEVLLACLRLYGQWTIIWIAIGPVRLYFSWALLKKVLHDCLPNSHSRGYSFRCILGRWCFPRTWHRCLILANLWMFFEMLLSWKIQRYFSPLCSCFYFLKSSTQCSMVIFPSQIQIRNGRWLHGHRRLQTSIFLAS